MLKPTGLAVLFLAPALLCADDPQAAAQDTPAEPETTVQWGAFVDTCYAWDFNQPPTHDRAYTTQPARHAEFNVNLAHVEAKFSGHRLRGRLAVQYGTSVQSNYAGEPRNGSISGPDVSRYLQEAVVGYQLSDKAWVDGGIFLSHLGAESWISRDNLTYTRSLVAEYSPYYEAGVKLTLTPSDKVTATLAVVNGWQNISAENVSPAGGLRVDWAVRKDLTLSYDNFVGDVAPEDEAGRTRFYQDVIAQYKPGSRWQFVGWLAHGLQTESAADGGTATSWGGTLVAKFQATPTFALAGRVERYSDPDQAILVTGVADAFETTAASIGADLTLSKRLLWRTEVRAFDSSAEVWPGDAEGNLESSDVMAVTSLALTF